MKTEKSYYLDPFLDKVEAQILEIKEDKKGLALILSKSIFYPGGGGQAADRGRINGHEVLSVSEDRGVIFHFVDKETEWKKNETVKLEIDWDWRFYNMQQHSGQHLLSRVLYEAGLKTVSVHLGEQYTLIEVSGNFSEDKIKSNIIPKALDYINRALKVSSYEITRSELKKLPLRREAGNWEKLRIVEIDGYEFSACGGTHVKNSSQIEYIIYLGSEKIRGNTRLKFKIGSQARAYIRQLLNLEDELRQELNTDPLKAPERIKLLKNEINGLKKRVSLYRSAYIREQAQNILGNTPPDDAALFHSFNNESTEDLHDIARYLAKNENRSALLMQDDRFVLTAPADIADKTNIFLREYRQRLSIKGGGPPGFAQGVFSISEKEALQAAFKQVFNK